MSQSLFAENSTILYMSLGLSRWGGGSSSKGEFWASSLWWGEIPYRLVRAQSLVGGNYPIDELGLCHG